MNVKKLSHHIAGWQQSTNTIPGFKVENRILTHELYKHKPNLPELKDELKKGGIDVSSHKKKNPKKEK